MSGIRNEPDSKGGLCGIKHNIYIYIYICVMSLPKPAATNESRNLYIPEGSLRNAKMLFDTESMFLSHT